MDKEKAQEMLYEYATGRLSNNDIRLIESELKTSIELQEELRSLRETLESLDEISPPQPSFGFRSRLKRSIEERASKKSAVKHRGIYDFIFRPLHVKVPLQAVGMIAIFFAVLMIYRIYMPEVDTRNVRSLDPVIGETVESVKNPIIVETSDAKETYIALTKLAQSHNAKLIRRKTFETGVTVYIQVSNKEEAALLKDLRSLGKIQSIEEGYKNREGNIVVVIIQSGN